MIKKPFTFFRSIFMYMTLVKKDERSVILILISSFLIMSLFSSYLFYAMIQGNLSQISTFYLIALGTSALFFVKQLGTEWSCVKCQLKQKPKLTHSINLKLFAALVGGAYVTFLLNHQLSLGGVLASSAVGLVGAYLFKEYAAAIYCGSFVGMACNLIFSTPLSFITASVVAGVLYVLSVQLFRGFGGKLGFTAFCGTILASILFNTPFRTLDPLSPSLYLPLFLSIILAGMATYFLQNVFAMDAVTASALVGLTIALVYPQSSHIVVVAAFCATFTGMVSKERAKNYAEMFFLTLLTAILFIAVASLFDGSGGKLGATAFLSTVSGRAMLDTLYWVKITFIKTVKQSVKIS